MNRIFLCALVMTGSTVAFGKLPPLDDAAKAKGAETAARAGWQLKVDSYKLCNVQDKVAAHYRQTATAKPAPDASAMPVSLTAAPAFAVSPSKTPTATAAAPATLAALPTPAVASPVAANPAVPGGTAAKVAGPATPTPCADPGPFAYNPVQQTPLETAGAHSPAGNAASPPSVIAPAASMTPAK